MKKNVLVLWDVDAYQKGLLEGAAPEWSFAYCKREHVTREHLEDANIILGNAIGPGPLNTLENLAWLQMDTAGTDRYMAPGTLPPGCILTCATGLYGDAISEHMLAMTFALMKNLHRYRDNQLDERAWESRGRDVMVEGATVLIIGSGDIGGAFARKMKALGATTIGVRRTDTTNPGYLDEVFLSQDLDKLLPRADVVAMALPGTAETKGMMSRERLAMLKPTAILLNVGRGPAIDTEALCDALEAGRLAGAGLDVTDPEPLPAHHRLWDCENVIITPHISGRLVGTAEMVTMAAKNLEAYRLGRPMESVVDLATGYRKI